MRNEVKWEYNKKKEWKGIKKEKKVKVEKEMEKIVERGKKLKKEGEEGYR